jgi:hypothetical protein
MATVAAVVIAGSRDLDAALAGVSDGRCTAKSMTSG